jgi:hypothetical protein
MVLYSNLQPWNENLTSGLIQVDYCAYKPTENNIPFDFVLL